MTLEMLYASLPSPPSTGCSLVCTQHAQQAAQCLVQQTLAQDAGTAHRANKGKRVTPHRRGPCHELGFNHQPKKAFGQHHAALQGIAMGPIAQMAFQPLVASAACQMRRWASNKGDAMLLLSTGLQASD